MSLPDHAAYVCWPPRDHLVNDEESGLKQHTCEGNSCWKRNMRIDKRMRMQIDAVRKEGTRGRLPWLKSLQTDLSSPSSFRKMIPTPPIPLDEDMAGLGP